MPSALVTGKREEPTVGREVPGCDTGLTSSSNSAGTLEERWPLWGAPWGAEMAKLQYPCDTQSLTKECPGRT